MHGNVRRARRFGCSSPSLVVSVQAQARSCMRAFTRRACTWHLAGVIGGLQTPEARGEGSKGGASTGNFLGFGVGLGDLRAKNEQSVVRTAARSGRVNGRSRGRRKQESITSASALHTCRACETFRRARAPGLSLMSSITEQAVDKLARAAALRRADDQVGRGGVEKLQATSRSMDSSASEPLPDGSAAGAASSHRKRRARRRPKTPLRFLGATLERFAGSAVLPADDFFWLFREGAINPLA